ncbi:unnamed protein product, partial [Ectocarpus sp. 12 AP-2014]
ADPAGAGRAWYAGDTLAPKQRTHRSIPEGAGSPLQAKLITLKHQQDYAFLSGTTPKTLMASAMRREPTARQ